MSHTARIAMGMAIILILGPLSIGLKIALPQNDIDEQHEVEIDDAMRAFLAAQRLNFFTKLKTINGDAYQMSLFHNTDESNQCLAMIYIMPMPINAEAEFILARPLGVVPADFFFVFNGVVTDRYPSAKHWSITAMNRLLALMDLPLLNATVYGVASTAPCAAPRHYPWHRLKN